MFPAYYQQPDQLSGPLPVSFTRHLPSDLKDHRFTFTRGDLSRENTPMKRVDNPFSNTGEYPVAAIVDWGTAGWYLSYWGFAYIFFLIQWLDN